MSAPSDDGTDSELSKYAPKWSREQPVTPNAERLRQVSTSAPRVPSFEEEHQDRRIRPLFPGPVPEPPQREDGLRALMGRFLNVAAIAALVAVFVFFGKPLLQRVGVLEPNSPAPQVSKPSASVTNDAPANRALVPTVGIAAAPGAAPS